MLGYLAVFLLAGVAAAYGAAMHTLLRATTRSSERAARAWELERTNLLDRIMFLSERPWSPPPSEPEPVFESEEELYYPERDLVPLSRYEV